MKIEMKTPNIQC